MSPSSKPNAAKRWGQAARGIKVIQRLSVPAKIVLALCTILGTFFAGLTVLPRLTIDKALCGVGLADACTPTPLLGNTPTSTIDILTPILPPPTSTPTLAAPPKGPAPWICVDFEDGKISSVLKQSGQWTIIQDGLNKALQPLGNSAIEFGDEQWTNYKLETDIRVTNLSFAKHMWIDFHTLSYFDPLILLTLDFQSNNLILTSRTGTTANEVGKTVFSFQEDKWFTLRVEVSESSVIVYINGIRQKIRVVDPIFKHGAIRLRALNNNVLFDNICVSSLEN